MSEQKKPVVKLVGQDGNIFNLLGLSSRALKQAGQPEQAKEMLGKVAQAKSYDEALQIICRYVDAR